MRRQLFAVTFVAIPLAAALTALGAESESAKAPPRAVELDALDKATDACTDFYQFACGGWIAKNPLPGDRRSLGRFQEVQERNHLILRRILDTTTDTATADRRKAANYYAACMDEAAIEAKGLTPLASDLATIGALVNPDDLPILLAYLHSVGTQVFFRFTSQTSLTDATQMEADVDQSGLTLPDRDYYLKTDAASVALRTKYAAHVERMFRLAGQTEENSAQAARAVLGVETKLAAAMLDRVKRRDPSTIKHPMLLTELRAIIPAFDWKKYFEGAGTPRVQFLNVSVPDYFAALNRLISTQPVEDLKDYLRWRVLHAAAELLPKTFADAEFDFFHRTLEGQPAQEPRWRRCVSQTDARLGEALGK